MSWKSVIDSSQQDPYTDDEVEEWFVSEEESPLRVEEPFDVEEKYRATQLRIIRTSLDFTLHTLSMYLRDNFYINLSPVYQRRHRWDTRKKSKLIESFLMNIPIPAVFLYESDYNQYEVMDGRQRLEAIRDFLNDSYALRGLEYWRELNGLKFSELPGIINRGLLRRNVRATVLLAETSHPGDAWIDVRMAIFERLNTGGLSLNSQELRNALYHQSPFNEMLLRLSRWDLFREVWNIPKFTEEELHSPSQTLVANPLYKTMADCELVLRYFAIKEMIERDLKGSLRELLDHSMKYHSTETAVMVKQLEREYRAVFQFLYKVFNGRPFVSPKTNRPSRPTYDAFMVAVASIGKFETDAYRPDIGQRLEEYASDVDNYEILVGRANTIEAIKKRVETGSKYYGGTEMNPIVTGLIDDLGRLKTLLRLIDELAEYQGRSLPEIIADTGEFLAASIHLHDSCRKAHAGIEILSGTLVLYLAGRFEKAVKDVFEDLCNSLASRCGSFDNLPKKMRENLVVRTAEVMTNPRRYGHGDKGVHSFVVTLADNLRGKTLGQINSQCLSITTENMRPDNMSDLFARVGVNNLWKRIGEQATLQAYFQTSESSRADKEAQSLLRELMDTRNEIAHPSGSLDWPSREKVKRYIDFCELVVAALSELAGVFAATLPEGAIGHQAT